MHGLVHGTMPAQSKYYSMWVMHMPIHMGYTHIVIYDAWDLIN